MSYICIIVNLVYNMEFAVASFVKNFVNINF